MKKNKIFIFILCLFSFIGLVDAKETYNFKRKMYCNEEEVFYNGFISKTNKVVVRDGDSNLYIWEENNTCNEFTKEDYLDYYNEPTTYIETSGNKVNITENNFTYYVAYILNDKEYDEEEVYYLYNSETNEMEEQNVNSNTENLNTYYVMKYLRSPESVELNSEITYYELDDTLNYDINLYNVVSNPNIENIEDYYIETTFYEILISKTTYTYNETIYNELLDNYNQVSVELVGGRLYAITYNFTEDYDIESSKYFDDNGNEVSEYRDMYVMTTDTYKFIYSRNENNAKIYNKETNELLTTVTFEEGWAPFSIIPVEEHNNNLYFLEYDTNWNFVSDYIRYYKVLEGDNQEYNNTDLTFRVNGNYNMFTKLLINNEELDTSKYTKEEGSTIITLSNDYLKTLKSGTYNLTFVYNDGANVNTTFTIKDETNPKTYDNIYISTIIGLISLISIISSILILKKQKISK